MTSIVLGYEGSECADRAVDLVRAMPWEAGTSVTLVTAIPDVRAIRSAWGSLVLGDPVQLERDLRAMAEPELTAPCDRVRASGLTCEPLVETGRPAAVLAAVARRLAADVVVVGSRGLGPLRSGLIGSVSMETVDLMPCPVLIARSASISSIVLATDGSPDALAAEQALTRLPVARQAPVTVVSALDVQRPWTIGIAPTMLAEAHAELARYEAEALRQHEAAVQGAVERLGRAGIVARAEVRRGHPASAILDAAQAVGADLVVLGTRGRTGLTRLALGSVSRAVAHGTPASVLLWRDSAPSASGGRELATT